jgi:rod shape-determining protein MreD
MSGSIYLAIPLMIFLGLVETAVLPHFPILGNTPQLALLAALSWGMLHGIEEGAIWAFFAGIFTDLFSISPMGVSSLAFMVGITAVLLATRALPTSRLLIPLILAGLSTLISFLSNILLLRLFGTITDFQSITFLPTLALINILFILPIYWLQFIINRAIQPRRVQL